MICLYNDVISVNYVKSVIIQHRKREKYLIFNIYLYNDFNLCKNIILCNEIILINKNIWNYIIYSINLISKNILNENIHLLFYLINSYYDINLSQYIYFDEIISIIPINSVKAGSPSRFQ